MAFILCSFSLCCDGFGGLWGPGGIHLVSCCDCFGGLWGALGFPLVPFDHAKTRVSRYSGFGMDFWFHFGTFGVPWATQWHQFSLPGPGRVGLLGSLGGLLAFILQPCGVLYSWLYIPGFVFALYFCICIPGLIFLVVDSWFYSSGFIFPDLSFGLYSWRIWCKTAESALLLLLLSSLL